MDFDDEFRPQLSEISIKNVQYQTLHFCINHFHFNVNKIKVMTIQDFLTFLKENVSVFIVQ